MRKILLLFIFPAFILLLLTTGCTKTNLFPTTKEKIIGSWKFKKVTFHRSWTLNWINISEEYSQREVNFFSDNTWTINDPLQRIYLSGTWQMNETYYNNGQSEDKIESVAGKLRNLNTGRESQVVWDYLNVTQRKIKCSVKSDNGIFYYTLIRE